MKKIKEEKPTKDTNFTTAYLPVARSVFIIGWIANRKSRQQF